MIYELLEDLKSKIEENTGLKCNIVTDTPGNFELNTAYITFPRDFSADYLISSGAKAMFTVDIDIISYQCDANRIDLLYKNIKTAMSKVKLLLNKCIDRLLGAYSDNDMDANCYSYNISLKQWLTADKIIASTRLSLKYKALIVVE